MNRDQALRTVRSRSEPWDVVVIGGGATGLGAAVDAAARGYATLVVEQHDFAHGTSSRSTKLIHGGVRYLEQGRIGLVRSALVERDLLLRNAPHIVHDLPFVIPAYTWWELPWYFAGLLTYDLLAGRLKRGRSRLLSRCKALERAPALAPDRLRGAVVYHDCQFDDARLAVTLARTVFDLGGTALNYARAVGLSKTAGRIGGVVVRDEETGDEFAVAARAVINATGVFVDRILRMDSVDHLPMIVPSQGIHIVLNREFLPGTSAVVVPHTDDGRILFAIPWHGRTLIGTTDTPLAEPTEDPRPFEAELDFLLRHAGRYLARAPTREDVLSVFAGLRPLVASKPVRRTAAVSRDHHIEISSSGLVTIAGGKWTTYRHMGEDVVNQAAHSAGLPSRPSRTHDIPLHGAQSGVDWHDPLSVYGTDADEIRKLTRTTPGWNAPLHVRLPYTQAEVIWGARHEMARTVDDVLSRRTRALFLDARASVEAAPVVAKLLAEELGHSEAWQERQTVDFANLAAGYLPD